jgi:hypothetical protein
VIGSERKQLAIREYNMLIASSAYMGHYRYYPYLEVVDDAFPIQKIVSDCKEVPVESLAPWIFLCSNFTVDQSLTQHGKHDHINMTHE